MNKHCGLSGVNVAVGGLLERLFRLGLAKTLAHGSARRQGRCGGNGNIEGGPYFNVGVAVVVCRSCTGCSVAKEIGRTLQSATVGLFV